MNKTLKEKLCDAIIASENAACALNVAIEKATKELPEYKIATEKRAEVVRLDKEFRERVEQVKLLHKTNFNQEIADKLQISVAEVDEIVEKFIK